MITQWNVMMHYKSSLVREDSCLVRKQEKDALCSDIAHEFITHTCDETSMFLRTLLERSRSLLILGQLELNYVGDDGLEKMDVLEARTGGCFVATMAMKEQRPIKQSSRSPPSHQTEVRCFSSACQTVDLGGGLPMYLGPVRRTGHTTARHGARLSNVQSLRFEVDEVYYLGARAQEGDQRPLERQH